MGVLRGFTGIQNSMYIGTDKNIYVRMNRYIERIE